MSNVIYVYDYFIINAFIVRVYIIYNTFTIIYYYYRCLLSENDRRQTSKLIKKNKYEIKKNDLSDMWLIFGHRRFEIVIMIRERIIRRCGVGKNSRVSKTDSERNEIIINKKRFITITELLCRHSIAVRGPARVRWLGSWLYTYNRG